MEWQVMLVLILTVPIILIPVAFIWYINFGGIYAAVKKARKARAVREKELSGVAKAGVK